eukprot:TRINITY_DN59633_c0_g1_i2.p1 TRINITY_DN59633_c0_g1~~TRINITY_DN59633_c0_g1_i2.p1  ORF type:complete len:642 (-),score=73.97 TRINITY_DN59633_c0_g1_i2:14-1747(-)
MEEIEDMSAGDDGAQDLSGETDAAQDMSGGGDEATDMSGGGDGAQEMSGEEEEAPVSEDISPVASSPARKSVEKPRHDNPAITLQLSGCNHAKIGPMVRGTYVPDVGDNHGKKVFKRTVRAPSGSDVVIYFWDHRDGEENSGWWIGNQVGGAQVWAYSSDKNANDRLPPEGGWRVPYNGVVDSSFVLSPREARAEGRKPEASFCLRGKPAPQAQAQPHLRQELPKATGVVNGRKEAREVDDDDEPIDSEVEGDDILDSSPKKTGAGSPAAQPRSKALNPSQRGTADVRNEDDDDTASAVDGDGESIPIVPPVQQTGAGTPVKQPQSKAMDPNQQKQMEDLGNEDDEDDAPPPEVAAETAPVHSPTKAGAGTHLGQPQVKGTSFKQLPAEKHKNTQVHSLKKGGANPPATQPQPKGSSSVQDPRSEDDDDVASQVVSRNTPALSPQKVGVATPVKHPRQVEGTSFKQLPDDKDKKAKQAIDVTHLFPSTGSAEHRKVTNIAGNGYLCCCNGLSELVKGTGVRCILERKGQVEANGFINSFKGECGRKGDGWHSFPKFTGPQFCDLLHETHNDGVGEKM